MLNIYTLTWNQKEKLKKLKDSLLPALEGIDYKWFIKDNNSNDQTVEECLSWNNPNIEVIAYKDNLQNFSEGMNYLYNYSKAKDDDFILLLNNDIIVNDVKSISNMIDLMKNDPSVGVVGARLLYTNTNKLQHAGVVFDKNYKSPFHYRLGQESDANAEKNKEFQVVTGAVLLTKGIYYRNVNTNNKSKINGMSEDLIWAFDDVDLCLSIKIVQGKKVVYCGKTNFFHEESASLKKNPVNKMFLPHNLNYLKNKWLHLIELDRDIYNSDLNHKLYNV